MYLFFCYQNLGQSIELDESTYQLGVCRMVECRDFLISIADVEKQILNIKCIEEERRDIFQFISKLSFPSEQWVFS